MKQLIPVFALVLLLGGCSDDRAKPKPFIPPSESMVLRGRELVNGLGACGYCHGVTADPAAALSGGRSRFDSFGEVKAANLTPARSGLGDWEVKDVLRAFRAAVNKDGDEISPDVHRGMEWTSDADLTAIISYLRVLPAVENEVDRRNVSFLTRNTTGFFIGTFDVRGYVPAVDPRSDQQYGRYLMDHVARCTSCHNSPGSILSSEGYLTGGASIRTESGDKVAPDITASALYGIGEWNEDDIVNYLKTGKTPDHKQVDPAYCPVNFYRNASERDLRALARFLKTVNVAK